MKLGSWSGDWGLHATHLLGDLASLLACFFTYQTHKEPARGLHFSQVYAQDVERATILLLLYCQCYFCTV